MGYRHEASTILGCEIDPKLIDPAKFKKFADNNQDDDDGEHSVGSSDGDVLRFAYSFIEKNFKNLTLEYSCVYDNSHYEASLSFKLGYSLKDAKKMIKYAESPKGTKEFKLAMIALGQPENYEIGLYSLPTCN
jgi:hypothetical protein